MDTVKKQTETTKQKRERSVNFTQEETELLVSLIEAKKHIIENKKSDASTWQDKEKAWKHIEEAFNCSSESVFRDHKHLKLKYEALKRDIRKKSALLRTQRYKTSGSTSKTPEFTPAEQKVKEIILLSVEGNEGNESSDSDFVPSNSSNNFIINIKEEDREPPAKKVCDVLEEEKILQYESDTTSQRENQFEEWNEWDSDSTAPKTNKNPLSSKQKEKSSLEKLTEEKLEIAKVKRKLITEELEQKLIQRKILEKELAHKDEIHKLEKEHLFLKIQLLKRQLVEK